MASGFCCRELGETRARDGNGELIGHGARRVPIEIRYSDDLDEIQRT